ncbi:hypothetical protein EDC04DRAFT_492136 [Pisolithus marmoratus]|nr:hypothetical protein EDC04DRAFT_492136 [Pisolithus marmoratus]
MLQPQTRTTATLNGTFPAVGNSLVIVISLFRKLLRFARKHSLAGFFFSLFSFLRRRLLRAVPRRGDEDPLRYSAAPILSVTRAALLGSTACPQAVFASHVPTRHVTPSGDGSPSCTDMPYRDNSPTGSLCLSVQGQEPPLAWADQHEISSHGGPGEGPLLHDPHHVHPNGFSASEGYLHDSRDGPSLIGILVPDTDSPSEIPVLESLGNGLHGTPSMMRRGSQIAPSHESGRSNRSVISSSAGLSAILTLLLIPLPYKDHE